MMNMHKLGTVLQVKKPFQPIENAIETVLRSIHYAYFIKMQFIDFNGIVIFPSHLVHFYAPSSCYYCLRSRPAYTSVF